MTGRGTHDGVDGRRSLENRWLDADAVAAVGEPARKPKTEDGPISSSASPGVSRSSSTRMRPKMKRWMTEPVRLRVRARRNQQGSILEWHPDDEGNAKEALASPRALIRDLYGAVNRSTVVDGDLVAVVEAWPRSGDVIDVIVLEEHARSESTTERLRMQASAEVAQ